MARLGVAAFVIAHSTAAGAQIVAPSAVVHISTALGDTLGHPADARDEGFSELDMLTRVGLGIAGGVVGTFAGGLIGAQAVRGCHGEECDLGGVLIGAAVGSVLGSAIISAVPQIASTCDTGRRIGSGVVFSVVGALLGTVVGATAQGGGVVLGFLTGSTVGSGVGASLCR